MHHGGPRVIHSRGSLGSDANTGQDALAQRGHHVFRPPAVGAALHPVRRG